MAAFSDISRKPAAGSPALGAAPTGRRHFWADRSLATKLLLLVFLAASPALVAVITSAVQERNRAIENADARLVSLANRVIAEHNEARSIARQQLSLMSHLPEIIAADPAACSRSLRALRDGASLFANFGRVRPDGIVDCVAVAPARGAPPVDIRDRGYFQRALATGAFATGEYQIGRITKRGSINFALPIGDESNPIAMLLFANYSLDAMIESLRRQGFPDDFSVTFLDPGFHVVSRWPQLDGLGESIVGSPLHRLVASGQESGAAILEDAGQERAPHGFVVARDGQVVTGYVVVSTPLAGYREPMVLAETRMFFVVTLILLAIALTASVGGRLLVLRGVESLIGATRRFAAGDFGVRVRQAGPKTELGKLGAAFNEMAAKVEADSARIQALSRVHALLTAINGAIVRIRDAGELASEVCRISVETGGYLQACIVLRDGDTSRLRLVAHCGPAVGYFSRPDFIEHIARAETPLYLACSRGERIIAMSADIQDETLRSQVLDLGVNAIASFPLKIDGEVVGGLALWSARSMAFEDAEELRLLDQLVADAGLGFDHIGAQTRLADSEVRFRATFDQAAVGIVHIAPDKRYLRVNRKFSELVGYSPAELLSMTWQDITHPDDMAEAVVMSRKLRSGEISDYEIEKRYICKDGHTIWVNMTDSMVREADGSIDYMITVVEDISWRKEAELELREAESRYRAMFDANPHAMWVYDRETLGFLAVNQAALDQYGYSREEFHDMTLEDIRPKEDVGELRRHLEDLSIAIPETRAWRHGKKDGSVVDVVVRSDVIEFDGRPARVVVVDNLTERLQALSAQAEAETKFRAIVEQPLVGIFIGSSERMEYANSRLAEIFGYSPKEIEALPLSALVVDEDWHEIHELLEQVQCGNTGRLKHDFRGLRKDGSIAHIGVHSIGATLSGKPSVIGVLQDITESVRNREQIASYVGQLERSVMATIESVSRMIDLRDPYTAGHEKRVGEVAAALGAELGLDENAQKGLRIAGHVHDIGKITIPAEILSKPSRLTAMEFEIIKTHPQQGYDILAGVDFPWEVAKVILQHHERMDGSGYPNGLKGEEICLEARIMAVADVVEAMSSHRPYRPGLGIEVALSEIEKNSGKFYDPQIAAACLRLFREKGYVMPAA